MTDFGKTKSHFHLPAGQIYLDGNSLGLLPKAASIIEDVMVNRLWDRAEYYARSAAT